MSHEPKSQYEQDFDATVVRYFSGRLTEPARLAFEAWLDEEPARRARVERLRTVWDASAEVPEEDEADLTAALAAVKAQIRARHSTEPLQAPRLRLEPGRGRPRRPWGHALWRVAAAVVLLVGGGLLWRSGRLDPAALIHRSVHTYTTGRGERAVINLPDNSTVTLHTESALEVPLDFGTTSREVRLLHGEGYFEVAHDPSHPFLVHAGKAVTRVLGTKFSVRSRAEDQAVRVAVAEGRVAVGVQRVGPETPVLTAGQVARLRRDGSLAIQSGVDVQRLLSWTDGRLVFDHAPLPMVLAELSRWFDRDFVLGDSTLAQLRLTTVLGGQSLSEAVAVLETALEVRATVDARRVVLSRR